MTSSPSARVLVVDDNAANRLLVTETLAPEGMDVVEVSSGAEALEAFAGSVFDVVLMDVRMPGLDGFATLDRIRALPGGADVPVVFLTALRDLETFDRARAAGALDYLTKPIRPSELLARVETLLHVRRLGSEVRAQLGEIRRQRDDLRRVQLQKDRLVAFVVHDLKSPLAAMKLHATLLARTPGLPAAATESTDAIREQCDRLNQLVMNLLDLAKADDGQLTVRGAVVDVVALASEVVSEQTVQAEARKVQLRIDAASPVRAWLDVDLVRRVLSNLVDNALRHTPSGGSVRIGVLATEAGTELRVEDTGPGIEASLRERIFDPFVQLEGGTGATRSGRGLGLAFCRAAVLAHGGTIHVECSGRGACFVVRLPEGGST